jgi:hypothetical protein
MTPSPSKGVVHLQLKENLQKKDEVLILNDHSIQFCGNEAAAN